MAFTKGSVFNKNSAYILLAGSLWGIISIFVNLLKEAGFNSIQCVAIRCFLQPCFLCVILLSKINHY